MSEITVLKHGIDLEPGSKPCHTIPYRQRQEALDIINFEMERMLGIKVIEYSQIEWLSTVVLVPKADDSKRFCVDNRRLNKMNI